MVKIITRLFLNSLLVSLFPIILIFNSILIIESNNSIFLIYMCLLFLIGLISAINLEERKNGFLVGLLGAANTLFFSFFVQYFLFYLVSFEMSFTSQVAYIIIVYFLIFVSYGYITEYKEKRSTPFIRATHIPFIPLIIFSLISATSLGLSFFLTYLINIASSFGYSIICGFGGILGTFIKTIKSNKPKEKNVSIPSTTSTIHKICPRCGYPSYTSDVCSKCNQPFK